MSMTDLLAPPRVGNYPYLFFFYKVLFTSCRKRCPDLTFLKVSSIVSADADKETGNGEKCPCQNVQEILLKTFQKFYHFFARNWQAVPKIEVDLQSISNWVICGLLPEFVNPRHKMNSELVSLQFVPCHWNPCRCAAEHRQEKMMLFAV